MQTGYKVTTSILDAARILQEVHRTEGDSIVETITRQIMDTKQVQTQKALVSMGWIPPTEGQGGDMVTECKAAVIRAAFGIQALEERELLDRLENLYLAGVKAGYEAKG